jgi:hypothetical protein
MPSFCYAEPLGDCTGKISKEHYLSAGVLRLIGNVLTTEGMPGVPRGTYSPRTLGTRILCETHNSMLSPLDAEATTFFSAVRRFDEDLGRQQTATYESVIVEGALLERWLLKVAFGVAAARRRAGLDGSVRNEGEMINVLFGRATWPERWGLYAALELGQRLVPRGDVEVVTAVKPGTDEIWSLTAACKFLPLTLFLGKPDQIGSERFRPSKFTLQRPGEHAVKTLRLTWRDNKTHHVCGFTRGGSIDGFES